MSSSISGKTDQVLTPDEGYALYRGKCKEYCEAAITTDPSLTLVRGYYYEPIWGTVEQHWWTKSGWYIRVMNAGRT